MQKIFHYYTPVSVRQNNRVAIAATIEDGIMKFSASRTSKKDNFSKRIGRKIAEGRLLHGAVIHEVLVSENENPLHAFRQAASALDHSLLLNPNFVHAN